MRIYGDSISGNCLKVKWTADLLGLGYDWIEVDVTSGETRCPEFLAMNPAGQVPTVMLNDARYLAQSNAIILHLAESSALIPSDAFQRAKMLEWMFWEQYSHEPYIAVARFLVRFQGKQIAELEPRLIERGNAALTLMDKALDTQPLLVGDHLTLADICLVAYTRMAPDGGFDLSRYPAVISWIRRVEAELGL